MPWMMANARSSKSLSNFTDKNDVWSADALLVPHHREASGADESYCGTIDLHL
jgi:hypothetical protein